MLHAATLPVLSAVVRYVDVSKQRLHLRQGHLGAGSVEDVGVGDGRHYSVNVPLQEGMDDESYRFMFEPIMQKVTGPTIYKCSIMWVCTDSSQSCTL